MKKTIVLMLSLLMIVSMVSAATLEELEARISLLENKTTQIANGQEWLTNLAIVLQNTVNPLLGRVSQLRTDVDRHETEIQSLVSWTEGVKYTDVCNAVQSCQPPLLEGQCRTNSDCGIPEILPNVCYNGNVYSQEDFKNCIIEHDPPMCEYYRGMDVVETCKYGCKDAACINPPVRYLSGKELVFDYNKDGKLDCFKYYSYFTGYNPGTSVSLAKTPEGYNIFKYGTTKVIIDNGTHPVFAPGTGCTI